MLKLNNRGFTLVEIMTVVFIIALLLTTLYIGTQPYMKRSRDTKRVSDMTSYFSILDKYNLDFESYPSNYGSGGTLGIGYCLSEIVTRTNYVGFMDMQFHALTRETSEPPIDPSRLPAIDPCTMTGSYLYSRLDYGDGNQMALLAARLETPTSANYGTGDDLVLSGSVDSILAAKKGYVPDYAPDRLFVIYKTR